MKKSIALVLTLLLATSLFAAGVTFPASSVLDVRSSAMGGAHVADYTDYFTLYRNPAFMEKSGKHWYWDTLTLNLAAPLDKADDVQELVNELTTSSDIDYTTLLDNEAVTGLLENGLNLGLDLNIPLFSFGGVGKNIGWGIYNKADVVTRLPSLAGKATVIAQVESSFIMGYGESIRITDLHEVSYGGSARLFALLPQAGMKASALDVLGSGTSALLDNAEVHAKTGVEVNLAAGYSYSDWLDSAVVIRNAMTPTYGSTITGTDIVNGDYAKISNMSFEGVWAQSPTVQVGVGVTVPTWWSMGIISNWKVYADEYDVMNLFTKGMSRNAILDLGVGTEISIIRLLDLRAGISDGYVNVGVGLNLGAISWDFAMYGKELSTQPGGTPQLNAALAMSLQR